MTAGHSKKSTSPTIWDFEKAVPGALPDQWTVAKGDWRIAAEDKAPSGMKVLAQLARNRGPIFNIALASAEQPLDLDVRAQLRAREGKIDQGGGVVWRAVDARNYYVARYNPLEDNLRVYTVKNGRRKQLASAEIDHEKLGHWYTMRVTMVGDQITAYLDGKKHLEVQDSTFKSAGRVGLWTKADAQTQFDILTVAAASKTP